MVFFDLQAGGLLLVNDTGYKLTAVIHANDGSVIGTEELDPFTSFDWSDGWNSTPLTQDSYTTTPYTVTWYCEEGQSYSTCSNIAQSANVAAQACPGNQSCPRKKPDNK